MQVRMAESDRERERERTFQKNGAKQKQKLKRKKKKKKNQHFIYDERCAFIHIEYDAYVNAIIMLASQEKCDRMKWAEMKGKKVK